MLGRSEVQYRQSIEEYGELYEAAIFRIYELMIIIETISLQLQQQALRSLS